MAITEELSRYKMPLLETVRITPTGKNFLIAITFMSNEQSETYRWVLEKMKNLAWTTGRIHFDNETTNRAENSHSILKTWLSTAYTEFGMVFNRVNSLTYLQIREIKAELELC
ncbi:hypothetical protein M9H77_26617 [Catharanthus roseus]|uniref:Uncharacterized protein n=1 Tax=Catharanthus roseus TaxID=4058 RepID=A0ACC0ACC3_CATRO|nr:hypothetical protein M9H77_26617 [Catharanthus roseus]